MKKNYAPLYSMLVLAAVLAAVFYVMMPQNQDIAEAPLSQFSTKRALQKVAEISKKPHFVGSQNHETVAQYLVAELRNLGLEPTFQEGFTMTEKGTLVKSKNILAKINGSANTKALLLLSHYDSAPHSYSYGASDDASGIATILESVRAFLHAKTQHKNDIILLFSDAEELGLNGAALFVTQHQWARNVGLALNFEARGSSGPGYMLMETNRGNAKMVEAFSAAKAHYPVSNSLMYSIYKMLPNDTDLTVFRENGKIQGFNFAFIDNHYNYHTAQDDYAHLDPKTLAHQGTYLVPLLRYFSNTDLTNLNSTGDKVYFNIPFTFVSYPFEWILPMLIIAFGLFLIFVFIGLGKQLLRMDEIVKGALPFFGSLIVSGILTYFGWELLLVAYPQYNDILHGFTYNGHDYIYAFVCLTLAVCFLFYQRETKRNAEMNQSIVPLFIWLVINIVIFFTLQGAAFLLLPVISSSLMLGYFVLTQKSNAVLNIILAVPALVIIAPFIQMFPIGLGLKILVGSAVLTVLTFVLLLPVFGGFTQKKIWSLLFFLISIGFFVKAHQSSGYAAGKAKPNSLVYVLNADTNKANWATYDTNLDEWTKAYLGENPKEAEALNSNKLYSKYGSKYTFMADAPLKDLARPTVEFLRDTVKGNRRLYHIRISPNRGVKGARHTNDHKRQPALMHKIAVLGCGWLGFPLAKSLLAKGFKINGSTTSPDKMPLLQNAGISPFLIRLSQDGIQGNLSGFLADCEILIVDIPPKLRGNDPESFVLKIKTLLPFIEKSTVSKVLFISSTSVFADADSVLTEGPNPTRAVDELSAANPSTESGRQLVEAEQLLQNSPHFQTTILRFGGLVGDDRNPVHFLAGRKGIENPDAPINFIHQKDGIGLIEAIIKKGFWGEILHGVAPEHPSRKEYYTKKALELQLPLPEFDYSTPSAGKTVSGEKAQTLLGYEFQAAID